MSELLEEWRRAKALFHYPTMKDPRLGEQATGARYDFRAGQVAIDPKVAAGLAEKSGASPGEMLHGLSVLAISQYMAYPRTLANALFLYKVIADFRQAEDSPSFVPLVFRSFCDLAAGVTCSRRPEQRDPYLKTLSACAAEMEGRERELYELLLAFLRGESDPDLTESLSAVDLGQASRAIETTRLGCLRWMETLRHAGWAHDEEGDEASRGGGGNALTGAGNGGTPAASLLEEIVRAPRRQVEDALTELADRLTRGEYCQLEQVVETFLRTPQSGIARSDGLKSYGIGSSGGRFVVNTGLIDYYRRLASNYPLAVSHRMVDSEHKYAAMGATEKFRLGSDPKLLLPFSSAGKIFPGLTRKVKITYSPRVTRRRRIPHALIVVDSSASMPDPAVTKSTMILAAFCAALSYYKLGSSIGVVNFSRESFTLPYTRDLGAICAAIVAYQGGGTVLDIDLLADMLSGETSRLDGLKREFCLGTAASPPEAASIDLLIFTDLGIHNLDELSRLVSDRHFVSRVTVISDEERGERHLHRKIRLFERVRTAADLVGITIGQVQASVDHSGQVGTRDA